MSRLVFLSWSYPPMAYPRAVQVARLASHVRHRPLEIYCLDPVGSRVTRSYGGASGIDLVRIPRALPTRFLELVFAPRRHRTLQEYDVRYLWWRQAAKEVGRHKLTSADVLVTFGQPMVDHLAGLELKRRSGVNWVAHFSDPWADNPFDPHGSKWRAREAAVIEAADLAIFTSQETVDLVFAKYPSAWRQKARVLPHSFDASLYPDLHPEGDRCVVRYLGNLFAGRGPEPLFEALLVLHDHEPASLAGVRFEFIGDAPPGLAEDPRLSHLPPECVAFLPRVGYRESLSLMKSADLLLNIDAAAGLSVFLPSKLIDYVGSGRPIFGISPEGTSARLIRELGGWIADPTRPADIADRLGAALAHVRQRQANTVGNAELRSAYEATAIAAAFEKMLIPLAGESWLDETRVRADGSEVRK